MESYKNITITILATSLFFILLLSVDVHRNSERRVMVETRLSLINSIVETKIEVSSLNATLLATEKELRSAKYQLSQCRNSK